MAAEQVRAAAAGAVALRAFGERGDERRMRGEAEIVVAREADDLATVDGHARIARGVGGAAHAAQPLRVERGEAALQGIEQRVRRCLPPGRPREAAASGQ